MGNIVEVRDLSYDVKGRVIYKNLNLSIQEKKITAILGPSGIGKTTLLRLISGQLLPTSGDIFFQEKSIKQAVQDSSIYELRKQMGMLSQSDSLFNNMTCFENVAYPLEEHTNLSTEQIKSLVQMKLKSVSMLEAMDLYPGELSGGMKRRVALARAIALDPELIMYDEPFVGQDPINMKAIVSLIVALNKILNLSTVVVSHDVEEVLEIADYCYIIMDGAIRGEGTPQELLLNEDPLIQNFVQRDSITNIISQQELQLQDYLLERNKT